MIILPLLLHLLALFVGVTCLCGGTFVWCLAQIIATGTWYGPMCRVAAIVAGVGLAALTWAVLT